jgi:hypothetical protein
MARNDDITLPPSVWTQLTNSNTNAVRVSLKGGFGLLLQATNGATPPTSTAGAVQLHPYGTLAADLPLADLWPGVADANRLWALTDIAQTVSVSHADA